MNQLTYHTTLHHKKRYCFCHCLISVLLHTKTHLVTFFQPDSPSRLSIVTLIWKVLYFSHFTDVFLIAYVNNQVFRSSERFDFSAAFKIPWVPTLIASLLPHWLLLHHSFFPVFSSYFVQLWNFGKPQLWSWALVFLICILFLAHLSYGPHVFKYQLCSNDISIDSFSEFQTMSSSFLLGMYTRIFKIYLKLLV